MAKNITRVLVELLHSRIGLYKYITRISVLYYTSIIRVPRVGDSITI